MLLTPDKECNTCSCVQFLAKPEPGRLKSKVIRKLREDCKGEEKKTIKVFYWWNKEDSGTILEIFHQVRKISCLNRKKERISSGLSLRFPY